MAAIINTGRAKIALQQGSGQPFIISKFVFANIAALDTGAPVNLAQGMPAAGDIVHEQAVTARGYVAPDQVVYSIIIGPDVGDFYFNWVGLVADDGTLVAVSYTPLQHKYKTVGLNVGNTLTRNFLTQYNNAQAITGINVEAGAWQIDFMGRLHDMEEHARQDMADLYGDGFFINDGFLIAATFPTFTAKAGYGHVGGLRVSLAADQAVDFGALPKDVYVDAVLQQSASGTTAIASIISSAPGVPLSNEVDGNGRLHYRVKIASVSAGYAVTDLRKKVTVEHSLIQTLLNGLDGKAASVHSHSWESIQGRPATFPPQNHSHHIADIAGAGNAATFNVTAHNADWTEGRVLRVGFAGLGDITVHVTAAATDAQDRCGFFDGADTFGPMGAYAAYINVATSAGYRFQLGGGILDDDDLGFRKRRHDGSWSGKRGLWHTGNLTLPSVSSAANDFAVSKFLRWANSNGHLIVDSSGSVSPDGSIINNSNPEFAWSPGYPNLVGYYSGHTYGLRVDSARLADLVGGYPVDVGANANTVVRRNENGYIYTSYISTDIPQNPSSNITDFYVGFSGPVDTHIYKVAPSTARIGLGLDFNTQAQAEAGTATTGAMTPLRVSQAIAALAGPNTFSLAKRFSITLTGGRGGTFEYWVTGKMAFGYVRGLSWIGDSVNSYIGAIPYDHRPRNQVAMAGLNCAEEGGVALPHNGSLPYVCIESSYIYLKANGNGVGSFTGIYEGPIMWQIA